MLFPTLWSRAVLHRIFLTMSIACAVLTLAGASIPVHAEGAPAGRIATASATVTCAAGRNFTLRTNEREASVLLRGQELRLTRRPSTLAPTYRSREATLIIDGSFVAFVLKNDLGFRDCQVTTPEG